MKIALISDVHGNLPALEAVLESIEKYQPDTMICLGDIVGYGPQPIECLELIKNKAEVVLLGNHEHAVLHGCEQFTPLAQQALDWTAQTLQNSELLEYLASLKPEYARENIKFVHGSIKNPLLDYVREADSPLVFYKLVKTLKNDFKDFNLCFVGHNHRAFLATEIGYIFPHDNQPTPMTTFFMGKEKAYVSIGSVGQPRDGDWRASWVMFDGEKIEYHRVKYDKEKTMELIKKAGLPEFLAERLKFGN